MSANILIIDDSALARRLTRQLLEAAGHKVEEASDGAQGLERYALHKHDVVVLDMVMHGMQGLDVLAKFQQLNPALPVIVVTADIQKSTREQVREAGAAFILNKPLSKDEFLGVVEKVLTEGAAWN